MPVRTKHQRRCNGIRLIIFDFGKTLFDGDQPLPDVQDVLAYLAEKEYWLRIASILGDDNATADDRMALLRSHDLLRYFEQCRFLRARQKFEMLYDMAGKVEPQHIAVIDDRAADGRALHWGYLHGALTIWLRRGQFANELPPPERTPTYTISALRELIDRQIL